MLISLETYRTCDFTWVHYPIPPLDPRMLVLRRLMVSFLFCSHFAEEEKASCYTLNVLLSCGMSVFFV